MIDPSRNLIWDLDGTLFDTYPSIAAAFLQTLSSYGQKESLARLAALAKVGLSHCAKALATQYGLPEEEFSQKFAASYRTMPKDIQPPFEGAAQVCQRVVSAGKVNAVATHRSHESAVDLLRVHNLEPLFVEIVAGDDGYPRKPDPAAFLAIVSKCKLDPTHTAAVGDRDLDIQAAKAAGIEAYLFGTEAVSPQPDFAFTDYRNLLRHLEGDSGA